MAQFKSLTHKRSQYKIFHERFEFYCVANNLRPGEDDNRKKAQFVTLLGQGSYSKLKALAHLTAVSDLMLDAILQHLSPAITDQIGKNMQFWHLIRDGHLGSICKTYSYDFI